MNKNDIQIRPTPNPNSFKFFLPGNVKTEGKATYTCPFESPYNKLGSSLFTIKGVEQVHFHKNTITVTKFAYEDWNVLEPKIIECLVENFPSHDPNYLDFDIEQERRKSLSDDLKKIEKILDSEIRPFLQNDGGDVTCINYKNNILTIKYEGVCGTCPSATMGTLNAIKSILQEKFNPEIEIYISS